LYRIIDRSTIDLLESDCPSQNAFGIVYAVVIYYHLYAVCSANIKHMD